MNEQEKQAYLEKYQEEKKKGVQFFPDILFKDAVVSLIVFLALIALAYFLGAPLEERANPADSSYTPKPEWYFLFLFQLLKYFPGELEVVGVVVIPTLAILLLLVLPFLDRKAKRHFTARPVIIGVTALAMVGVIGLTVLSIKEAPPPSETIQGDLTAVLYTQNCAPCHGASIPVTPGADLHSIIAQGSHDGMPAWSADLSSDQIDALAGFILSPGGSVLFTENCGECHAVEELVSGDPLDLKQAVDGGLEYPPHASLDPETWTLELTTGERTALLNFLVAPDGKRLFATNCSPCHGQAVAFTGDETSLSETIRLGGLHLDMPSWGERLSPADLAALAQYTVDPSTAPEGEALYSEYCSACHGERIPSAATVEEASEIIATGGAHETMPIWGEILTPEQLDALAEYTLVASSGSSIQVGLTLYGQNCAGCHGDFGEGGQNPARQGDIIAPISTAEYLHTRDDYTLYAIIANGQPNFGMSPFGTANGGPLDDDQVNAIVAYIRSWEANPPVEMPPEFEANTVTITPEELFATICTQCHGPAGEGGLGPALSDSAYQAETTDEEIFASISEGHPGTSMIAWGDILPAEQITALVEFIRQLEPTEPRSGPPTFEADILPIFEASCNICHGIMGGWNGTTYTSVMTSGDHAPVVIPGDVENSLLAQKLLGTHSEGDIMPPAGALPDDVIQIILDWIAAGALEN